VNVTPNGGYPKALAIVYGIKEAEPGLRWRNAQVFAVINRAQSLALWA